MEYHLAIDIGASSGRHLIGWVENGIIHEKEVHRFPNGASMNNGHLCWNTAQLFNEILCGMKKCKEQGVVPATISVDTWGVDFVLLDDSNTILGDSVSYRDRRTESIPSEAYKMISEVDLYKRTGIQRQSFNTIFQLLSLKKTEPAVFEKAQSLLMIPDYFHFLLTGKKIQEYTNATTTGLVSASTNTWDFTIIRTLGLPEHIFGEIQAPGTIVGTLSPSIQQEVGYNATVVLCATHDTGSAFMASPSAGEHSIILSSGTWSLMGIERTVPDCTERSMSCNFTNEGGYGYRYRFLKNIMGLWMIQSIKHELNDEYSFNMLSSMAEQCMEFSIIDCNDPSFLSPSSMIVAVQEYCKVHHLYIPQTPDSLARTVYESLAACYQKTAFEIESIAGVPYNYISIIGGGCKDAYLNRLTAQATGKKILAGPVEATATGNLIAQMIATRTFSSLSEARRSVKESFDITEV